MKKFYRILTLITIVLCTLATFSPAEARQKKMKALIISGQNNHNWQVSHRVLRLILSQSGLFDVDIALTPSQGGDMSEFNPEF